MTREKETLDTLSTRALGAALDRRQLVKRSIMLGLSVPVATSLIAACGGDEEDTEDTAPAADSEDDEQTEESEETEDDDEPADDAEETATEGETEDEETEEPAGEGNYGGSLQVALIGEPPTLDLHTTTATVSTLVTMHMYETLFTWDSEMQIMPELAESVDVSDDGLTITVNLLEGVNFHNGDVMTSSDVITSIERWGSISGLGGTLLEAVDEIEAVDDHTIDLHMNSPYGSFTTAVARQNQGCTIHPSEILEAAGENPFDSEDSFVGTGPYMFVERQADRHILLERFEDYTDRSEPPNGYGGSKAAYLDEIYFRPVPDEAGRIAGLQAGDYHYLESIVPDHFETLEDDPNVVVEILPPTSWGAFIINMRSELTQDVLIRQAVQAALDHEPILQGSYGTDFYRVDPGIMFEETAWHTTVGEENFNQADPERARELLDEAGYDGTPLRIIATQEYQYMYYFAVIAEQQLADAGFEVDVQVYDWATMSERRSDETAWDMFTTGITFRPDPVMLPFMGGDSWPGWWGTEEKMELAAELQRESDFDTRFEIWESIQELVYEEVPFIKLGDSLNLNARSPQLQNFEPMIQISAIFYNVWLEE